MAIDLRYLALCTLMLLPGLGAALLWSFFRGTQPRNKVRTATFTSTDKAIKPIFSKQSQLDLDKELYYQLHNLEDHPGTRMCQVDGLRDVDISC